MAQNGHAHTHAENGVEMNGVHVNGHEHKSDLVEAVAKKPIEGFVNVADQDSKAYLRNYKTHQTGISHEEMIKAYSEWANNYDEVRAQ